MRTIVVMMLFLASATLAQSPTFQPVGTTIELMKAMVIPSSDVLFKTSEAPKDDKEWAVVQNNALILAESGNLLMMTGRAKDAGEWMKDSKALVDAGTAAFKAAKAKDFNKLGDISDDILTACETCHKKYKPE
jgi:hypothetical protein